MITLIFTLKPLPNVFIRCAVCGVRCSFGDRRKRGGRVMDERGDTATLWFQSL